jgi:hypothetical protein
MKNLKKKFSGDNQILIKLLSIFIYHQKKIQAIIT